MTKSSYEKKQLHRKYKCSNYELDRDLDKYKSFQNHFISQI